MQINLRFPSLPKLLTAAAATLLVGVLGTTMVAAQQSQPVTRGNGELTTDDSTVAPGQSFTATGSGFAPGALVSFTLEPGSQSLGSALADASGDVIADLTIPGSTSPGSYLVKATGADPNAAIMVLNAEIEVTAAGADGADDELGSETRPTAPGGSASGPAGTLPRTGADLIGLGLAGVVAIGLGATALVARGRRAGP